MQFVVGRRSWCAGCLSSCQRILQRLLDIHILLCDGIMSIFSPEGQFYPFLLPRMLHKKNRVFFGGGKNGV